MNPLIEKYFRGELTEPEESNLEKQLTDSEQTAWEFGQAAEEAYHRYGLPEPDLPGGDTDGNSDGPHPLMWMIPLLGLLFLGGYGWLKIHKAVVVDRQDEPAAKSVSAPVRKLIKHQEPVLKAVKPEVKAPAESTELPPGIGKVKAAGNNLKVVVNRETPGPASVKVVNAAGVEIRLLYSGTLQAGKWSFEWDGRSGDGKLVEPGKYQIQVVTEAGVQSREVVIH